MPKPERPDFAPLTDIAWKLLLSVMDGSSIEELAKLAADGGGATNKSWQTVYEADRKNLRNWKGGRTPRQDTADKFFERLMLGIKLNIDKEKFHSADAEVTRYETILQTANNAPGPFSALASFFRPTDSSVSSDNFFAFSSQLDQFSQELSDCAKTESLDAGKTLILETQWLDDSYWQFPEAGYDDPVLNRRLLRDAANVEEFNKAVNVVRLNVFLSWLTKFDVAITADYGNKLGAIPLFLPLIGRFTSRIQAVIHEETEIPFTKWRMIVKMPVDNLISMLKQIARELDSRTRKRTDNDPVWAEIPDSLERINRSEALTAIREYDTLSTDQFAELLKLIKPKVEPNENERLGINIFSLNLAANAFSMLMPRNDAGTLKTARRTKPLSITVCEDLVPEYKAWWLSSLKEAARDAPDPAHPWPEWFSRSMGDRAGLNHR